MFRAKTSIATALIACLAFAPSVWAQDEADFTFSADELDESDPSEDELSDDLPDDEPTDDAEEMTFDAVDTEKAATDFEQARKAEIDNIRVIQRRPFLRTKRVELAPMIGTNVNDPLINFFVATLSINYFLSEVLSLGVSGTYSLGQETDLFDKVINDYALFPEISKVLWSATLDFQYIFIYGKFAMFNKWIFPWDLYGVLGAGATQTELAIHPTLAAGIGQRYFMSKWLSLNIEVRDNVYNEDYQSGSQIVNNLLVTMGVSFFIPPSFKYKTLK